MFPVAMLGQFIFERNVVGLITADEWEINLKDILYRSMKRNGV